MGVRYEARPVSELVTQIAGDMSCLKLSSLKTGSTLRICGDYKSLSGPVLLKFGVILGKRMKN